jgi:hypothetical protein
MVEIAEAPKSLDLREGIRSIRDYFDTPVPAITQRIAALEHFEQSKRFDQLLLHIDQAPQRQQAQRSLQELAGFAP